jgi:hypothetical protein
MSEPIDSILYTRASEAADESARADLGEKDPLHVTAVAVLRGPAPRAADEPEAPREDDHA